MSLLFVTGTGTDIGKTYVAAALTRHLRTSGFMARVVKPIVSGFDEAAPNGSDSAILLAAMDEAITLDSLAAISPWRYAAPLAPNMAARREGKFVDFAAVVAWCRSQSGPVLIEGVGGIMSPIADDHTVLDWIAELGCAALLVGGTYLGAISHTLTAIESLRARGIALIGLIVSESLDGVDLDETIAELYRFAPDLPLIALPRLAAAEQIGLDQMADIDSIARQCLAD